jgi:hypothetical protein
MWIQSEFNFLRLQINITQYTFVYVLNIRMLTTSTFRAKALRREVSKPLLFTFILKRIGIIFFNGGLTVTSRPGASEERAWLRSCGIALLKPSSFPGPFGGARPA